MSSIYDDWFLIQNHYTTGGQEKYEREKIATIIRFVQTPASGVTNGLTAWCVGGRLSMTLSHEPFPKRIEW